MGEIFELATRVLVCLGEDPDGGARDVAALVEENRELVSPYTFVEDILLSLQMTHISTIRGGLIWEL